MDRSQEREIIGRVRSGEREAYALLVEAYKGPVFNLAFRMTGNYQDADDLTQETFIRSYQKLWQFDQNKSFFTWLYTIGINLIRNHLKKKTRDVQNKTADRFFPESQTQENDRMDEELLSKNILLSRLEKNIQLLSVDLREVIILRFHQELTFEEIAAVTGDSLGAVKMRIYRGLEKLKAMMDK